MPFRLMSSRPLGKDVYGEKRIQVDGPIGADGNPMKLEYRVWNPFRSKLAAAILGDFETLRLVLVILSVFFCCL